MKFVVDPQRSNNPWKLSSNSFECSAMQQPLLEVTGICCLKNRVESCRTLPKYKPYNQIHNHICICLIKYTENSMAVHKPCYQMLSSWGPCHPHFTIYLKLNSNQIQREVGDEHGPLCLTNREQITQTNFTNVILSKRY